jgi:hypothetical protein
MPDIQNNSFIFKKIDKGFRTNLIASVESELRSTFLKPMSPARQSPFFKANNSGIKLASKPANPVKPVIKTV